MKLIWLRGEAFKLDYCVIGGGGAGLGCWLWETQEEIKVLEGWRSENGGDFEGGGTRVFGGERRERLMAQCAHPL